MKHLRDYQAQAIDQIEKATKALYVLPTGGGKTIVATDAIMMAVQRGERVLMLTHRREILRQTSLKIPIDHGLIQAGLNIDLEYPVQVASIQTLWARCMRSNKIPLPPADLIIVDEAHHIAARTWQLILDAYPHARRIGLTATPCRSDGRGLGNYFDELILGPQIPDLIAQKHLVPTVYYAPAEPDLKGVETRQGDYAIKQLADRMNRDDLVGDIVSNWHKLAQRRKTLVFCVDVAHSWKRFKTMEEAQQTASIARKAKDQTKVAYGRRNASRKNISRAWTPCLVPGTETMPETAKSPGMETMSTEPGTETMPTSDISGGGGAKAAGIQRGALQHAGQLEWTAPARKPGTVTSKPVPETRDITSLTTRVVRAGSDLEGDVRRSDAAEIDAAAEASAHAPIGHNAGPPLEDDLSIPAFLRRASLH
jgi:hypothetical protein